VRPELNGFRVNLGLFEKQQMRESARKQES
jgi:hypothetical protein